SLAFIVAPCLATLASAQTRWQPLAAPPGRAAPAMAYDWSNAEIVMHGGELPGSVPPRRLGDTWSFDAGGWQPEVGPGPGLRSGHALVFDANRQRVLLFGGFDGSVLRDDTWEWDGVRW